MGNDNKGRRYDDEIRAAAVALVIDKKLPVVELQSTLVWPRKYCEAGLRPRTGNKKTP
jgi:hypothetical protein